MNCPFDTKVRLAFVPGDCFSPGIVVLSTFAQGRRRDYHAEGPLARITADRSVGTRNSLVLA